MPNKHVTFSNANLVYPLNTPSPTFSDFSLPSTGGPKTPPSPRRSLLPLPSGRVEINRSLGFQPHHPILLFDLSLPWEAVTTNTSPPTRLSKAALYEPATNPPTPYLQIKCPHLPWTLEVVCKTTNFVTIVDVLAQLYSSLRLTVSEKEFHMESRQSQREITAAFNQRVNRDRRTAAVEERKGLKRIDSLKGDNQFMGLSSTKVGPDMWTLNVRRWASTTIGCYDGDEDGERGNGRTHGPDNLKTIT